MYVHRTSDGLGRPGDPDPDSFVFDDYQMPDGTNMRCLTPQLFDDAIYSLIFCVFHMLYRPQDASKHNVWFPGKLRRRVLAALYRSGRWSDVGECFEYKLGAMPFSSDTKTTICMEFFGNMEPNLLEACRALANEPGFIFTAEAMYRSHY